MNIYDLDFNRSDIEDYLVLINGEDYADANFNDPDWCFDYALNQVANLDHFALYLKQK